MKEVDHLAVKPTIGPGLAAKPANERDHDAVMHRDLHGHTRLPSDQADRLRRASRALKAALKRKP